MPGRNRISRWLMKLADLIQDPRNPMWVPYHLFKRRTEDSQAELKLDLNLKISLTVDVEHDYGIPSTLGKLSTVEEGVKSLLSLFSKNSIEGTFFVSHPIVENFSNLIKKASKRHEIGVHGYNHECWSKPKWWLGDSRILEREEKEILLEKMVDSLSKLISKPPKSFRAPYMTADEETLVLLDKHEFEVDSSSPSYHGTLPKPTQPTGLSLKTIPVSARPKPKIRFSPFPHAHFYWLNTKLLHSLGLNSYMGLIEDILRYQFQSEVNPHLVILLHQWEFVDMGRVPSLNFEYAASSNFPNLQKLISELENRFNIDFLPIAELNKHMDGIIEEE